MKKTAWFISIILILFLIFFFWRTPPANAQQVNDAQEQAAQIIGQRLVEITGQDVGLERLGLLQGNRRVLFSATSPDQVFLFSDGENHRFLSANLLQETGIFARQGVNIDAWRAAATTALTFGVAADWAVFEYHVDEGKSLVFVSPDGQTTLGALGALSREVLRFPDPEKSMEGCQKKVLSKNILGKPAEWIEVCGIAACNYATVKKCQTDRIQSGSWYFGHVDYTPKDTPKAGQIENNLCTARANYSWGIKLGSIKAFGAEFGIDNFGKSATGIVEAQLECQ